MLAFTIVSSSLLEAQVHGNPGGGGPGKGNEEYNYCQDLKITVEEHIAALLKLEKKQYLSDKDFFQYLDDEVVKAAVSHWDTFNQINKKKNDNSHLLPCGQIEKQESREERNEKLELLKKIRWTINKSKNGYRICKELFNRYYAKSSQLDTIIKNYENQEK